MVSILLHKKRNPISIPVAVTSNRTVRDKMFSVEPSLYIQMEELKLKPITKELTIKSRASDRQCTKVTRNRINTVLALGIALVTGAGACHADPAHEPYTCSWQANDTIGGTETMSLVAHQGKLYAGIGYWMDSGSYPGPHILVLDSPTSQWRVDHTFDAKLSDGITPLYRRVAVLQEITFSFDGRGNSLKAPVSLLLAANDNTDKLKGDLSIFSRDDSSDKWTKMTLPIKGRGIRSLGLHRDPNTGAEYVFLGTCDNGFVRGCYDESKPGKISWSSNSEPVKTDAALTARIMAFGNGEQGLFAFAKPSVYEYVDGSPGGVRPYWWLKYSYQQPQNARSSGLRGATYIHGELFGFLEATGYDSKILRMFPVVEELNIRRFLQSQTGSDFMRNVGASPVDANIVGAYNNMTKVTDPVTRQDAWLVGLGFNERNYCPIKGKEYSSWFLARSAAGSWTVHDIPPLNFISPQPCPPAVRTIAVSPFAQDQQQAIYIGFYDANDHACHNTAHIFRVGLATALRPYSAPKANSK